MFMFSSFGLYSSKVKYPQMKQPWNLKNFVPSRNPLSSTWAVTKDQFQEGITGKLNCILKNSRSFQERFICSGVNSECAHLEAGKPYCIVPPPIFHLSLPYSVILNSSQCSSFICGGDLHWKAKPRRPWEGGCRQLRNVCRLAWLSLLLYGLLPCQCNLTTCCYRQYKWPFLSGVKRRRIHVICSFGHPGQLLNVKTRPENKEGISFLGRSLRLHNTSLARN